MANRSKRAETAKQTVEISKSGRYQNAVGETIRIKSETDLAIKNTIHYPSHEFESVIADVFHYHLLENKHLQTAFKKVFLAVLDRSKGLEVYKSFENRFGQVAT